MNGIFFNDIFFQCSNKNYVQIFQILLKTMINDILLEIKLINYKLCFLTFEHILIIPVLLNYQISP